MLLPRPLRPGARIAIVTPSSPYNADEVEAGMDVMRELGLQPFLATKAPKEGDGMTPAPLMTRVAEIAKVFTDASVGAVVTSTGGIGSSELISLLPYRVIAKARKPVMGFSDTTSLLLAIAARSGLVTFLGPSATIRLDPENRDTDEKCLRVALALLSSSVPWNGKPWSTREDTPLIVAPGVVTGPMVGGNLTVFAGMLSSQFLPPLDGAVLFLEDVNVSGYELRRFLGDLANAGVLSTVAGICFGEFSGQLIGEDLESDQGPTCEDVIDETFGGGDLPVMRGLNFSHGMTIATLPIGVQCTLDATAGRVTFGQALEP